MQTLKISCTLTYFEEQARFEAMRCHARKGHILQKHEDLRKEYDKLIRRCEREEKYMTSRLALNRAVYLDKMKEFEAMNGRPVPKDDKATKASANKHNVLVAPPKLQRRRDRTHLFRVIKRDGQELYVKSSDDVI